jgi:hypothetical protein
VTEHSDVLAKLKKASKALDDAQAAAKETAAAVSNAKQAVDKAKKDSQQFDTARPRKTHTSNSRKPTSRKSPTKKRR